MYPSLTIQKFQIRSTCYSTTIILFVLDAKSAQDALQ